LPAQKQAAQREEKDDKGSGGSLLSFVPEGMPRSVAEYLVALLPGAVLLFAFFLAAELAVVFIGGPLLSLAFLPVICVMPILAGVVSTLMLEKIRHKPLTLQRGAIVGGAASLLGAFVSIVMLIAIDVAVRKPPFGDAVTGIALYILLLFIVAFEGVLGALGGALVARFVHEV